MGVQELLNKDAFANKYKTTGSLKPGSQTTAEQKVKAVGGTTLLLPKLLPAENDDISLATEMAAIAMTESAAGSGIFTGSVGGNGFTFIPVGDTQIADIVAIEVTYASLAGNEKVDTIPAQQIAIGKNYTFISKVMGKWTVKVTSASKTVKGVQLTGL